MTVPMTPYSSPGVFNVRDPWYNDSVVGWVGMTPGSAADPNLNRRVLQHIIGLAQTTDCQNQPYGAIIVFPGHETVPPADTTNAHDTGGLYPIEMFSDGSPTLTVYCNWPIRFLGTGDAKLVLTYPSGSTMPAHFFDLNVGSQDHVGGMVFEDLTFGFPTVVETMGIPKVAGIHTNSAENVRINRCVFEDCPIGVWIENGLQCAVSFCTFQWQANAGIGIKIGNGDTTNDNAAANDCHISDCAISGQNAPTPCTGMLIEGSEHLRVDRTHIYGCFNGIQIVPGPATAAKNALRHSFTDTTVYINPNSVGAIGNAVLIQPQASTVKVAQIQFTSCFFELSEQGAPEVAAAGILVDASNATIETVRFVSCFSARWPGPGLKITGSGTNLPQNIEVLGGMYAANKYPNVVGQQSYGIYIGPSSGVRVIGADCVGSYTYVTNSGSGSTHQQAVGIYVDGSASGVVIDGCDVTGNGTNGIVVNASSAAVSEILIRDCNASGYTGGYATAINIAGTLANLIGVQVVGCAGYNDQCVALTTTVPSSGFGGPTLSYFGPVTVFGKGSSGAFVVKIATSSGTPVAVPITDGTFPLAPGDYLYYSGGTKWGSFLMIGQ